MDHRDKDIEAWFSRRRLVLDLASLSQEEREEGSALLGGSGLEFVGPGDTFEYNQINLVVFNWGDPKAETIFNSLLEHDDNPAPDKLFPFNASAIIGDTVWTLALQDRKFEPHLAYPNDNMYVVIDYDSQTAQSDMYKYLGLQVPRPELLGKVGPRWVAFEMGTNIR